MANYKRGKPRKQVRHGSSYPRGLNETRDPERPVNGKGVRKEKPKKPFGVKETVRYDPRMEVRFEWQRAPHIKFYWYESKRARNEAYKRMRDLYDRRPVHDHTKRYIHTSTFEKVER